MSCKVCFEDFYKKIPEAFIWVMWARITIICAKCFILWGSVNILQVRFGQSFSSTHADNVAKDLLPADFAKLDVFFGKYRLSIRTKN